MEKGKKLLKAMTSCEERILTVPVLLGSAIVLGLIFTLLHCFFLVDLYRDVGGCYATFTRIFASGNFLKGLNPSLPVLQIAMAGTISFLTGLEPLRALLLIGGIFYLLTIFPLYFLLKRFLSPRLAAWGVLAFILAPKIIRFSLTGLPEPARNFFLTTALLGVFLLFDQPKIWKALLLGISLAGFTLSRSEGLLLSGMMLFVLAIFLVWRQLSKSGLRKVVCQALLYPLLAWICFFVLLIPRLYVNYQQTGYPTPDARLNGYLHHYLTPSIPLRNFSTGPIRYTTLSTTPAPRRAIPFLKRLSNQLKQLIRGSYEFYLLLAIIGLGAGLFAQQVRGRFLPDWKPEAPYQEHRMEYAFIAILIFMHAMVYWPLNPAYRYYTFCVPLLMPLTMAGMDLLWAFFQKHHLKQIFAIGCLLLALAQIYNGLDSLLEQNKRPRLSGEWIAEKFTPENRPLRILNYNSYIVYWINAEIINLYYEGEPLRPEYASDFDLAILEPNDTERITVLRSRKDLREISTPFPDVVTIFERSSQEFGS